MEKVASVIKMFFDRAWDDLGARFHQRVLDVSPEQLTGEARAVRGPGAISAMIGLESDGSDFSRPYSPEAWRQFLDGFDEVPALAWFDIITNDEQGRPDGQGLIVQCKRVGDGERWLLMQVSGDSFLVEGANQQRFVGFLEAVANHADPVYGEISWKWEVYPSVLELALGVDPVDVLPRARRVLRGYSWITLLPEEIGNRLGGEAGLNGTGAFVRVKHLAGGGYLAQATECFSQYDEGAAERVYQALVPVLPPGRPNFWNVHPPNVLADRDPAEDRAGRISAY